MDTPTTSKKIKKKMLVITPQQIAKLGLTAKIQSVIAPQLEAKSKKAPEKKKETPVPAPKRVVGASTVTRRKLQERIKAKTIEPDQETGLHIQNKLKALLNKESPREVATEVEVRTAIAKKPSKIKIIQNEKLNTRNEELFTMSKKSEPQNFVALPAFCTFQHLMKPKIVNDATNNQQAVEILEQIHDRKSDDVSPGLVIINKNEAKIKAKFRSFTENDKIDLYGTEANISGVKMKNSLPNIEEVHPENDNTANKSNENGSSKTTVDDKLMLTVNSKVIEQISKSRSKYSNEEFLNEKAIDDTTTVTNRTDTNTFNSDELTANTVSETDRRTTKFSVKRKRIVVPPKVPKRLKDRDGFVGVDTTKNPVLPIETEDLEVGKATRMFVGTDKAVDATKIPEVPIETKFSEVGRATREFVSTDKEVDAKKSPEVPIETKDSKVGRGTREFVGTDIEVDATKISEVPIETKDSEVGRATRGFVGTDKEVDATKISEVLMENKYSEVGRTTREFVGTDKEVDTTISPVLSIGTKVSEVGRAAKEFVGTNKEVDTTKILARPIEMKYLEVGRATKEFIGTHKEVDATKILGVPIETKDSEVDEATREFVGTDKEVDTTKSPLVPIGMKDSEVGRATRQFVGTDKVVDTTKSPVVPIETKDLDVGRATVIVRAGTQKTCLKEEVIVKKDLNGETMEIVLLEDEKEKLSQIVAPETSVPENDLRLREIHSRVKKQKDFNPKGRKNQKKLTEFIAAVDSEQTEILQTNEGVSDRPKAASETKNNDELKLQESGTEKNENIKDLDTFLKNTQVASGNNHTNLQQSNNICSEKDIGQGVSDSLSCGDIKDSRFVEETENVDITLNTHSSNKKILKIDAFTNHLSKNDEDSVSVDEKLIENISVVKENVGNSVIESGPVTSTPIKSNPSLKQLNLISDLKDIVETNLDLVAPSPTKNNCINKISAPKVLTGNNTLVNKEPSFENCKKGSSLKSRRCMRKPKRLILNTCQDEPEHKIEPKNETSNIPASSDKILEANHKRGIKRKIQDSDVEIKPEKIQKCDETLSTISDTTIVAKKRGRPRKSKEIVCAPVIEKLEKRKRRTINYAILNDSLEFVEENTRKPQKVSDDKSTVVTSADTSVPKKRGRKKKIVEDETKVDCVNTSTESMKLEEQSKDEVLKVPKKRGRKKKVTTVEENEDSIVNTTACSEADFKSIEIVLPKKRGRKKKIVEIEDNVSGSIVDPAEDSTENPEIKLPKKRGRKKKILDSTLPESNDVMSDSTCKSEIDEDSKLVEVPKKKRGRPKRVRTDSNGEENEETIKPIKAKKSEVDNETDEDPKNLVSEQTETPTSKRRRTNGTDGLESYTAMQNRILIQNLMTQIRAKVDRTEDPSTDCKDAVLSQDAKAKKKPGKLVKCAICKQKVNVYEWGKHKQRKHNNIAWREGETPMDLDNIHLMMHTLNKVYKKFKMFYCDTCPETKKSVIGYLGHKAQCNRTFEEIEATKIECRTCGHRVMPFSINEHVSGHRRQSQKQVADQNTTNEADTPITGKRQAAKEAAKLILRVAQECGDTEIKLSKNLYTKRVNLSLPNEAKFEDCVKEEDFIYCRIGQCDHKADTLEAAKEHFESCKSKLGKVYLCKICQSEHFSKADIFEHIHSAHPAYVKKKTVDDNYEDVLSSSNSEDESIVTKKQHNKTAANTNELWKGYQLKFLSSNVTVKEISMHLNHMCFTNTLLFCENNYNEKISFFNDQKSTWTPLEPNRIKDYLPVLKLSAPTGQEFVKVLKAPQSGFHKTFHRYKLFESTIEKNGTTALFCGGPVSALAWAPTPFDSTGCEQILGVSVLPDPDKGYTISKTYTNRSTIQFWNYGPIDNDKCVYERPKLEFCLAHDHGGVWSMEWCPSGCYSDDQLGLLAVGGTDSFVYGYSVQRSNLLSPKVFTAVPIFKLVLSRVVDFELGGSSYHTTRISWTKTKGHSHICVGYSNGVIAVYDVTTSSNLCREYKTGTHTFYPIVNFQGHNHMVTALSLYHLNGGKRWVASASFDRTVKFWDLNNLGEPICSKQWFNVKEFVWMMNWLCTIDVHDDSSSPGIQATILSHIRDFSSMHNTSIIYSNCSTNTVSASDWGNMMVQGNQAGELVGCHMKHLLPFGTDVAAKRFCLGYVRTVADKSEKIDSRIGTMSTYDNVCAGKSLVFSDFELEEYTTVVKTASAVTNHKGTANTVNINEYPLRSINSVAINPNRRSFLYTASGYQTGFVRVMHAKFLSKTVQ